MDTLLTYLRTLEIKGEVQVRDREVAEMLVSQGKTEILDMGGEYLVYKPLEYDSSGRMKYNPRFHKKKAAWKREDLKYLQEWYNKIGPVELSFALDRTPGAIMQKAKELRKKGMLEKNKDIRHSQTIK